MKKKLFNILIVSFIIIFSTPITICNASDESSHEDSSKAIYLTFDDGPSKKVLPDILDILSKENVKATFFIIGKEIDGREDLLKRIHEEGHSIGLHSFTHDRNNLYRSNDSFLNEMIKTQEIINKTIGTSPKILRFPFGANNITYKLTPSMVELLHKNNFKIYDWNVDSGDGANYNAPANTYIKNSKSTKNNIILLMHCADINKNTVKALPSIISYYKSNGYIFKTIDESTDEYFHCIK